MRSSNPYDRVLLNLGALLLFSAGPACGLGRSDAGRTSPQTAPPDAAPLGSLPSEPEGGTDAGPPLDGSEEADVAPVDPSTACLGSNDVFVIEGNDDLEYSGPPLVTSGGTGWSVSVGSQGLSSLAFTTPDGWWILFYTGEDGPPLAPGTYTASISAPEGPALVVKNENASDGCGTPEGTFTVLGIDSVPGAPPALTSFTATFLVHCSGTAGPGNDGCIHFQH